MLALLAGCGSVTLRFDEKIDNRTHERSSLSLLNSLTVGSSYHSASFPAHTLQTQLCDAHRYPHYPLEHISLRRPHPSLPKYTVAISLHRSFTRFRFCWMRYESQRIAYSIAECPGDHSPASLSAFVYTRSSPPPSPTYPSRLAMNCT